MGLFGFLAKAGEAVVEKGAAHKIEGSAIKDAFTTGKSGKGAVAASDLANPKFALDRNGIKAGLSKTNITDAQSSIKTALDQNIRAMAKLDKNDKEFKALELENKELKVRGGELQHLVDNRASVVIKGGEWVKANPVNTLMGVSMIPGILPGSSKAASAVNDVADSSSIYPAGGQVPEAYGQPAVSASQMPGVTLPSANLPLSPALTATESPAALAALGDTPASVGSMAETMPKFSL